MSEKAINLIKSIVPKKFYEGLRKLRRFTRRGVYHFRRGTGLTTTVTKTDIIDALRKAGLQAGDSTIVHSSLSKIGFVEGGPQAIIQAFLDVLGPEGTLAMPTISITGSMAEYLATDPVFDPKQTPSTVGKLTEVFWRSSKVRRSLHPTHSVAAVGRLAEWLTGGHETCSTPFGKRSPFGKLLEINALIICLGIDIHVLTEYHVFEDLTNDFPFNPYLPDSMSAKIISKDGAEKVVWTRVHDPRHAKVRIDSNKRVLNVVRGFLLKERVLKRIPLGDGVVSGIRFRCLYSSMDKMLKQSITIYEDHCAPLSAKQEQQLAST